MPNRLVERSDILKENGHIWYKELFISIIDYLLRTVQFDEKQFVQNTLLTICYPKERMQSIIKSVSTIEPTNQVENQILSLLKSMIKSIDAKNASVEYGKLSQDNGYIQTEFQDITKQTKRVTTSFKAEKLKKTTYIIKK